TVSQGMNFPSEFDVIAGDRRFDLAANSQTPLAAHELLNAAGRAGRAGSRSHALVLVIPGQVVAYDGKGSMGKAWFELRNAFAQSDQCVTMRDALSAVLETDEEPTGEILPVIEYIGRRLEDTEDAVMRPSSLRRSFAAYVARASGTSERFERGIARVVASQLSADAPQWLRRSSRASGLPPSDIEYFASQLETALLNDIEDNDIN
ncbi:hypothetical protein V2H43_10915, partial [Pasteurella multocida]|uniref:hypothetical protein n=1 Tax=Pasteurella multocida TaxID=747 RepID=UPI002EBCCC7A|nr:hypothetical protein [Pasteurella multocida]